MTRINKAEDANTSKNTRQKNKILHENASPIMQADLHNELSCTGENTSVDVQAARLENPQLQSVQNVRLLPYK